MRLRSSPYSGWMKISELTDTQCRKLFEEFRDSKWNITQFCTRKELSPAAFSIWMRREYFAEWNAALEKKKPKTTGYQLGYSFERRVYALLEGMGYFVMRSSGSKGIADLIAVRKGSVLFVQCKRSGKIESKEWNELFAQASKYGADAVVADCATGTGANLRIITGPYSGREWPSIPF
jgi:hypothetical protein